MPAPPTPEWALPRSGKARRQATGSAAEACDDALLVLLRPVWNTSSRPSAICLAFCRSAIEHAIAQRVLIDAGLTGAAICLIRRPSEAVVHAAWVPHAATDDWLEKFSAPVPDSETSEPQRGPPAPAVIDTIGAVAGPAATELKRMHDSLKAMRSFERGGVRLVMHALRGRPARETMGAFQNHNPLPFMLANVIVIASQDSCLRSLLHRLSTMRAACLPPQSR